MDLFGEDLIGKHHETQARVPLYIPKVRPQACSVLSAAGRRVVAAAEIHQVKQMCSSFAWKYWISAQTPPSLWPGPRSRALDKGSSESLFLRGGHDRSAKSGQKQNPVS